MKEFISKSIEDTYKIACEIKKDINKGDIILLYGDLGAGKTQFVKQIVKAFNGNENDATSPTFTIVNEYNLIDVNPCEHNYVIKETSATCTSTGLTLSTFSFPHSYP